MAWKISFIIVVAQPLSSLACNSLAPNFFTGKEGWDSVEVGFESIEAWIISLGECATVLVAELSLVDPFKPTYLSSWSLPNSNACDRLIG